MWVGIAFGSILVPAAIGGLVCVAAGRWDLWQAWAYAGLTAIVVPLNAWAASHHPDLIEERLHPGGPALRGDKPLIAATGILFLASLVIAGIDLGRAGGSPPLPAWAYAGAAIAFVAGQLLMSWAKRTCRFFSSVVRIQPDRGHEVCREGPYARIRHPGYAGGLLYMLASPILLGSMWALLPQLVACALLVLRTFREERFLKDRLPGYADYAREVRFRYIPGVF